MKSFYKIVDNKAQVGQGTIIPDGFIEYEIGSLPIELVEALEKEALDNELQAKINEAKEFLNNTDKKVLPDYEFRPDDKPLEYYLEERKKAREFIRSNS